MVHQANSWFEWLFGFAHALFGSAHAYLQLKIRFFVYLAVLISTSSFWYVKNLQKVKVTTSKKRIWQKTVKAYGT